MNTPAGARPGNDVLITKGPAIEAVGIMAVLKEEELLAEYPKDLVEAAKAQCGQMTVVKDAMTAMGAGGVTAMHDATEGGVLGGLFEIANASGVGMEVEESSMVYPEDVKAVCAFLGIDPLTSIAEGTLLITCEPTSTDAILSALAVEGIEASVIGKVTTDVGTRRIERLDGTVQELEIPEQDPFWPVFFETLATSE